MNKPERGLRAKAGLYEDSDFIRGFRLTDAESMAMLFSDMPEISEEMEAIIESYANIEHKQWVEITPELLDKQQDKTE